MILLIEALTRNVATTEQLMKRYFSAEVDIRVIILFFH